MTATYRAVMFDLFDTLVHFDPDRLPTVEVGGRTVRSSAGRLHAILTGHAPDVSLQACYDALRASWELRFRRRAKNPESSKAANICTFTPTPTYRSVLTTARA